MVKEIPLEKIFVKKNIRTDTDEELGEQMESMLKMGQLQPIGVYPRAGGRYEIVWGHRRFRAAQMNGESTIAANILDPECVSESDIPLIKLQENTVRKQLTTEEILAAADEIKRQHQGMTDRQVDVLIGKRPGYLGFRRSVATAYDYLAARGLKKKQLNAMSIEEVLDLRARMENAVAPKRSNKGAFHRFNRTPDRGIQILTPRGPNVVVVCSGENVKSRVICYLKNLAKAMGSEALA